MTKSTSTSSLRPGRTFSSRRHIKAKVFSAREEDLPQLNDLDEEEVADEESEKLKKIKLPSTFLSSFKLEKFNPNPPQVDAQPDQQTLSNKPVQARQMCLKRAYSVINDNLVQPNKPTSPSTFFGLGNKDEISNDVPPPNFFATLTPSSQPNSDSSSLFKKVDPVQKSGLFNFQATNNPVTNTTGAHSCLNLHPILIQLLKFLLSVHSIKIMILVNLANLNPRRLGLVHSRVKTYLYERIGRRNQQCPAQTQSTKTAVPTFSFNSASLQATPSIFGSQESY
ncbi:hypothetical protein Pst134EA_032678 [Puccinia striiformis f. sp. tritici]|uniref:uncharacterized protein n=1 Tax=Puccinia striiformis f. sp. tritici TaxID=168172 RepID=UPI002007A430|nr:uncharacterized protein Pst134EA_032678 [Puccinia striiformis f. sp. tritici]KAH9441689.1 hypothetical protein Pst134EA_032678 [Puccinia striiformis f. sp. tritici]